jgi:hypothetical protein
VLQRRLHVSITVASKHCRRHNHAHLHLHMHWPSSPHLPHLNPTLFLLAQGADTDPAEVARMREAMTSHPPKPVTVTLLNYRKDGTPFWNALHVAPVRDADGVLEYYIGVQLDVSQQQQQAHEVAAVAENAAGRSGLPHHTAAQHTSLVPDPSTGVTHVGVISIMDAWLCVQHWPSAWCHGPRTAGITILACRPVQFANTQALHRTRGEPQSAPPAGQ